MLTALYQDEEILVVDKPPGLASQPGAGVRLSLVEAVDRDFGFRPFLVHRLDRETAGCIIVARSAAAAARWSGLIGSRELGKVYLAIVAGTPEQASGRLGTPVRVRGREMAAESAWKLLGRFGEGRGFAALELELGTGRTHQLRLQLAEAGLPILGDEAHGDFALNKELRRSRGLRRLLLLARRLRLPGGFLVEAPLPEHFRAFLAGFEDGPAI